MLSYADPPLILRDVFPNIQQVQDLLTTHAPYTPLGGWYNPELTLTRKRVLCGSKTTGYTTHISQKDPKYFLIMTHI